MHAKRMKILGIILGVLFTLSLMNFNLPMVFASTPTIEWYNCCEDLSDWTLQNGATGAIDYSNYMEGSGSLNTALQSSAPTLYASTSFSSTELYFGFWVSRSSSTNPNFRVYGAGSYYVGI